MRSITRPAVVAIVAGCLVMGLSFTSALAQDATPEGDCPIATAEENIALVERAYTAINEVDSETIDDVFADDLTHNLNRYGLEDDATTNEDEAMLAASLQEFYPGSSTAVDDIFAVDDRVVAMTTQTISEHTITGEAVTLDEEVLVTGITIFTIECGEISELHGVQDELGLLVGLGFIPDPTGGEATPAP